MALRLGIDTGGTYTDAVLVDAGQRVRASAKALTTPQDLSRGIGEAIGAVLGAGDGAAIELVSISTTLATNALVEAEGAPVCLLLAGFRPAQLERPDLRAALAGDPAVLLAGGHRADGSELAPLDLDAARAAIDSHAEQVSAFALSAQFAVRNPAHERILRELVGERTGLPVSCGHQLSARLDAPRRALTALINARLIGLINQLLSATRAILAARQIEAPLMVVKGDGSLLGAAAAAAAPVQTILSGPAASLIGAAHLAGRRDAVVADMGGTTTDIARLVDGAPLIDPDGATVGGHRTLVEAVRIHTHALGGDSAVGFDRERRALAIGPRRALPLCLLASRHPAALDALREQAARDYPRTHDGQFALRRRALPPGAALNAKARYLWEALAEGPLALSALFNDQTLDRALARLVQIGAVLVARFTPTDASHLLGLQRDWSAEAAALGARLLRRYSAQNLGPHWADEAALAQHVVDRVGRRAARHLWAAALADTPAPGVSGADRGAALDQLADLALAAAPGPLGVQLSLREPLIGLGAPAHTYLGASAAHCHTELLTPPHAEVANALGAVLGRVCQRAHALITAIDRVAVRAHCGELQRDFAELESAAAWCSEQTAATARAAALAAGAAAPEVAVQRDDTVASKDGETVFFESRIVATASGRPALAAGIG